jgi:AraC family transcriptional regulator
MTNDTALDYVKRINRAIDYIVQNLDQPLKLEIIARAACFSPFHFHRIFRAMVGETLNQFIKRLRLERALWILSHQPARTLTEISLACGFSSQSDFSRSFKERYGVPPSGFDVDALRAQRREDLVEASFAPEARPRLREPGNDNPDGFSVQLKELPARTVAYIRVLDPYRPNVVARAARRLVAWAEQHHLADGRWLGYQWEDPEIVALKDCRYDVAVEVPDVKPSGEIGRFDFPPMLVAQVEVRGSLELELRALDWLIGAWLPNSGYVPTDQPFFEAWNGRPFQHGEEYFELFVEIPVEKG